MIQDDRTHFGVVVKLTKIGGSKLKCVSLEDLTSGYVMVSYNSVTVAEGDDGTSYEIDVNSQSRGGEVNGRCCFPLAPDPLVKENGAVCFSLKQSEIQDIGFKISETNREEHNPNVPSNDGTVKCAYCDCKLQLKSLKIHVAQHILNKTLIDGHTEATCGFCGRNSCTSTLIQSSIRGTKKFFKVESNCVSKITSGKQLNNFSHRTKCTNIVLPCSMCTSSIWKYNFHLHLSNVHGSDALPLEAVICDEEKKYVMNKKL